MGIITMSSKEKKRIPIFEELKRGEITQKAAAKKLNLSIRQTRRIEKRYLKSGVDGLVHKNRGRPGNRKTPEEKRKRIISLYQQEFNGFRPTHASEKLREKKIDIHHETLRLLLIKEGLWQKERKRSKHRKQRERKEYYGEMVQLDGSVHDWFEGRAPMCTLIGFIDDATGKIYAEFAKNESHKTVMDATKNYCLKNGKPLMFYADCGKTFRVNLNNSDGGRKTQYERALIELDVGILHAHSPQAKGRIERLFGTLQDRLVKEMRLLGISDIANANQFLKDQYIEEHNKKYAKKPAKESDLHRETNLQELNNALCLKSQRILGNDFTISYRSRKLQLYKPHNAIIRPKDTITIWEDFEGNIRLFIRKVELFDFKQIAERVKNEKTKPAKLAQRQSILPSNHPLLRSNAPLFKKPDISILAKGEDISILV